MYNFWKNNKNVILIAVAMFVVSITVLLFFLTEGHEGGHDLSANVIHGAESTAHEQSEKDYREKFASNDEPFIVLGLDGRIDFASWDYQEFSGYETEELEDQMIFKLVDPADLPMLVAAFGETVATEDAKSMVGPYKIKNKEGEYRTHIASIYPVVEEGKVVGIIFNPKDITEAIDSDEEESDEKREDENSEEQESETESEEDTEDEEEKSEDSAKDEEDNDTDEQEDDEEEERVFYGPKIKEMNFEGMDYYSEETVTETETVATSSEDYEEESESEKTYKPKKETKTESEAKSKTISEPVLETTSEPVAPVIDNTLTPQPTSEHQDIGEDDDNDQTEKHNKIEKIEKFMEKKVKEKAPKTTIKEEKVEQPKVKKPQKEEKKEKDDNGKMIRNTNDKDENRLVVNKLAAVFTDNSAIEPFIPQEQTLYYWYPYFQL